jgi:hypothetical protein
MKTTEARMTRLERDNRRLKVLSSALFCAVLAVVTLGQAKQEPLETRHFDIVYARKFVLVDANSGAARAQLAAATTLGGWAGLHVFDAAQRPAAALVVHGDGSPEIRLQKGEELAFHAP